MHGRRHYNYTYLIKVFAMLFLIAFLVHATILYYYYSWIGDRPTHAYRFDLCYDYKHSCFLFLLTP